MNRESENTAEVILIDTETGERISSDIADVDLSLLYPVTLLEMAKHFDLSPEEIMASSINDVEVGFFFDDIHGECYYLSKEDIVELRKEEIK